MPAKNILIMRNAEKRGDPRDPGLSSAGKKRAKKRATFIPSHFGAPDFIFAAASSVYSSQAYKTVEPLARTLGIPIDATIDSCDYAVLADQLLKEKKYQGSRVLVCWDSSEIPLLLAALSPEGSYASVWDEKVFNLIIDLNLDDSASRGRVAYQVNQVREPY
jgi:hypothetical protein